MKRPRLLVLSGPSGVGKTTVCDLLLARPGFERVVTATTRDPRAAERYGVDYFFLTEAEFDQWIAEDRFLEWAHVHDHRYGSPRDQAEAIVKSGKHALLNIDVQGAAALRTHGLDTLTVILLPPSQEELERRLRGRATDSEEAVARRLEIANAELARQDEFDVKVVNDESVRAAGEIQALLAEE